MRIADSLFNPGAFTQGFQNNQMAGISPDQQEMMKMQMRMQKEQEAVAFISNILKKMNEMNMTIINNMK